MFPFFRALDWVVGIGAYYYMYYFIFTKVAVEWQMVLFAMLTLTIALFVYGFKFGDYDKSHTWYHVFVFLTSGLIVFMGV